MDHCGLCGSGLLVHGDCIACTPLAAVQARAPRAPSAPPPSSATTRPLDVVIATADALARERFAAPGAPDTASAELPLPV